MLAKAVLVATARKSVTVWNGSLELVPAYEELVPFHSPCDHQVRVNRSPVWI